MNQCEVQQFLQVNMQNMQIAYTYIEMWLKHLLKSDRCVAWIGWTGKTVSVLESYTEAEEVNEVDVTGAEAAITDSSTAKSDKGQ